MSEPDNFLARWARRKRDVAKAAEPSEPNSVVGNPPSPGDVPERPESVVAARRDPPESGDCEPPQPVFDLTQLPSIDSITAASDIRAFLAPGVPAALTRAALRRAWVADPAIRDFVGLADYDWDFNTPGAITGFQPLEMTEELRRRVTEMVGRSLSPEQPEGTKPTADADRTAAGADENSGEFDTPPPPAPILNPRPVVGIRQDESLSNEGSSRNCEELDASEAEDIASQHRPASTEIDPEEVPRRQGRALPK